MSDTRNADNLANSAFRGALAICRMYNFFARDMRFAIASAQYATKCTAFSGPMSSAIYFGFPRLVIFLKEYEHELVADSPSFLQAQPSSYGSPLIGFGRPPESRPSVSPMTLEPSSALM